MTADHSNQPKPLIFHFITSLDIGGTEMMLLRLLPTLRDDFTHVVCSFKKAGVVGEQLHQTGIGVTSLNFKGVQDIRVCWRLYRQLRQLRPAIMVNYLIHADLLGRVIGRIAGVKYVISSQRGSLLQWGWLRIFDRLLAPLVTRYVVQTESAKKEIAHKLRISEKSITIIPNGIDVPLILSRVSARTELGLNPESYYITCVSQLRRRKGHDVLLTALAAVHTKFQAVHLLLVGEGELRSQIEAQIKAQGMHEYVHLLGERANISQILAATNLFILPTLAEGMSNALLEAMAAGVACVVSDIPPNKVLITDTVNGRVFASGNADSLRKVLAEVIPDRMSTEALGVQARQTIASQFSLARTTTGWRTLLLGLLSSPKSL